MTSGRTPLLAGNWKMNLDHLQATHLVQKLDWTLRDGKHDFGAVEVAVLPPFTDLRSVQTLVDGDKLALRYGAQDLSVHDSGAYTGEISGAFLAKLGCTYVAVGHSERREYHHETDEVVNAKVKAAYRHGITPIFCCGEGLEIRKAGTHVEHVVAPGRGRAGRPVRRAGPQHRRRLRAHLGDRHRRGGDPRGRAGGLRGDPYQARRALQRRRRRRHPGSLRRFGEVEQRRGDHGQGGRRRRPRRRGLARPGRVRRDLPLPGPPRHGLTSP
jgi:hypothetical protein